MPAADHSRRSGIALEKAYQFLVWLVPTLEKFPKSQKFLLGDRIRLAGCPGRVRFSLTTQ